MEKQAILRVLENCIAVALKASEKNGARIVSDAGLRNPTFEIKSSNCRGCVQKCERKKIIPQATYNKIAKLVIAKQPAK